MTTTTGRRMSNAANRLTATETVVDWRTQSACRNEDPELFFPVGTGGLAELQTSDAKTVCARCPVMDQCLQWALETGQHSGVWGGLSEDERQKLRGSNVRVQERERREQREADADAFLAGELRLLPTKDEELAAIVRGLERGMSYPEIDKARGQGKDTTASFVSRMRKRYAKDGRTFPELKLRSTAKFTDAQVVAIRETYAEGGVTDFDLSLRYGVDRKTISTVLSGKSYRNAGGPIRPSRFGRPPEASRVGFVEHQAGYAAAS